MAHPPLCWLVEGCRVQVEFAGARDWSLPVKLLAQKTISLSLEPVVQGQMRPDLEGDDPLGLQIMV